MMNSFHKSPLRPLFMAALTGLALQFGAANAQQFFTFDGGNHDSPRAVTADSSGNVFVGGLSRVSSRPITFAVVRHSNQGNSQWLARLQAGPLNFGGEALDVVTDANGNVYAAGYVLRDPNAFRPTSDWVVVSYSPAGVQRWSHVYAGTTTPSSHRAVKAILDPRGAVYVVGNSSDNAGTFWLTTKYSLDGAILWQRTNRGAFGLDRPIGAKLDSQGNLYVLGSIATHATGFQNDAQIVKYDPSGAVLWNRTFTINGVSNEEPADLAVDTNDAVYVTGISFTSGFPEGPAPAFLVKYSSAGTPEFLITGASAGGSSIAAHPTGIVTAGGGTDDLGFAGGLFVSKFTFSGIPIWSTRTGSFGKIEVDTDGNTFFATSVFAPAGAAYQVLKLNPFGQQVSDFIFPEGDGVTDTFLASNGDFLVTGSTRNLLSDMLTIRIAKNPAPAALPADPTDLFLLAGKNRLTLRWSDNASNESGFRIERSVNGGVFVEIAQVGPNTVSFTDTGLNKRSNYAYRVRAFNGVGNSGYSNTAVGKPK